jgi:hypothetical protein
VTEYSDSPGPADSPADAGTSPGASGTDAGALAVEDRLPARQQPDPPAGGDDPDYDYDYDEADFAAGYDGDLAALTAEDRLPPRQDASAAEADDPQDDDEAGPTAGYGADAGALAAEDRLPARQQPDADGGNDLADDYGEADPDDGYDGDLDAPAEDQAPDTGDDHAPDGTTGDQDQPAGEVLPASGEPGDLAAEVPGASAAAAPEQEDGNHAAPEESPVGAPAETGSPAEADAGIRPGEAAQPADSHADPEADLKELKAEYEASLKDLKTELQALKDLWGPVSDAPEGTRREAGQPNAGDRELTTAQEDERGAKPEGDRPGLWSNAKSALYGAVGTTVTLAGADQFFPGAPHAVVDLATGALTIAAALVPTMREGWKRKHDDSQGKS